MAIPGDPFDEPIGRVYELARAVLPPRAGWFDAHTHIGEDDPDGQQASAAEILAGLDRGAHERALVFPLHEPGGYPPANDRVLAEAERSAGRLVALARLDPRADAIGEARRCLTAGARGFKLHPRAERFTLAEPAVERIVALAHERRLPVLIHAGRGIPSFGPDILTLAECHPDARLILAHAGISDLALLAAEVERHPNLFFDTSWWNVADLLALFASVPPGRILYASDMPYGTARVAGLAALRCALAVGLGPAALTSVVGGQLARLVAGEDPAQLGPAPGAGALRRHLSADRAVAHLSAALSRMTAGADPDEPLALAQLACSVPPRDEARELLAEVGRLIADARAAVAQRAGTRGRDDGHAASGRRDDGGVRGSEAWEGGRGRGARGGESGESGAGPTGLPPWFRRAALCAVAAGILAGTASVPLDPAGAAAGEPVGVDPAGRRSRADEGRAMRAAR